MALTEGVFVCRPLSPPSLRPPEVLDMQPDRAHSSPSEIAAGPFSSRSANSQSAGSQAAQRKQQDPNVSSSEPEGTLLRHEGSSSTLQDSSRRHKLPPGSSTGPRDGTAGSTLTAGVGPKQGSTLGANVAAAFEPGYREGSAAQPAPWPHEGTPNGTTLPALSRVSRSQQLPHDLHREGVWPEAAPVKDAGYLSQLI